MSLLDAIQQPITAGRPTGIADDADLARIQAQTGHAYTPEEIFVFACTMADGALVRDHRAFRFGATTLRQFAADAAAGTPYHTQHEIMMRNLGYTYAGHYDAERQESRAAVYIPRGRVIRQEGREVHANQEIADIETGMRRAVSVGPIGAFVEYRCDLCGKDVFQSDCPHIPGANLGDGWASMSIENARLGELSGVSTGALAGARIGAAAFLPPDKQKALTAKAQTHLLAKAGNEAFEEWLAAHLLVKPATLKTDARPGKENESMDRNLLTAILARRGITLAANATEEQLVEAVAKSAQDAAATNPILVACVRLKIEEPSALDSLSTRAAFGDKAAAALKTDLAKQSVRCFPDDAQRKDKLALYDNAPLDEIEQARDRWKAAADEKFGVGKDGESAKRQSASPQLVSTNVFTTKEGKEAEEADSAGARMAKRATEVYAAQNGVKVEKK